MEIYEFFPVPFFLELIILLVVLDFCIISKDVYVKSFQIGYFVR